MLPFEADQTSDVPLWVQLRQRLVYLIESGYFKPGDQLPTVRGLASEMSINYNTVNKAYLSLAGDGYIESTRGRGAFVRSLSDDIDKESIQEVETIMEDCIGACRELGLSYDDIMVRMTRKIKRYKQEDGNPSESDAGKSSRVVRLDMNPKLIGKTGNSRTGA